MVCYSNSTYIRVRERPFCTFRLKLYACKKEINYKYPNHFHLNLITAAVLSCLPICATYHYCVSFQINLLEILDLWFMLFIKLDAVVFFILLIRTIYTNICVFPKEKKTSDILPMPSIPLCRFLCMYVCEFVCVCVPAGSCGCIVGGR